MPGTNYLMYVLSYFYLQFYYPSIFLYKNISKCYIIYKYICEDYIIYKIYIYNCFRVSLETSIKY